MDQQALELKLKELTAEHDVVGVSVAVHDGTDLYTAAAGVTNLRTGQPVTPDTIFQIGSITKVYTATLVMQLVDEGLVDLDAPVSTYLPDVRLGDGPDAGTITVRHLLSHTGGLFGDFFEDFGRDEGSAARMAEVFDQLETLAPPGELMSYCNAGFVVLGLLVEELTGLPFSAAFRERLAAPLGVEDTVVLPEEAILRSVAVGHVGDPTDPDAGMAVAPKWSLSEAQSAAGALPCATTRDLVAFARMHLASGRNADGEQVLSAASATLMRERVIDLPSNDTLGADGWGLGWILFEWEGREVFGHDGATLGQNSFLRIVPDRDAVVAITFNGGTGTRRIFEELTSWALQDVADLTPPTQRTATDDVSAIDLDAFVGTFASATAAYTFRRTDDGLTCELEPLTDHAKQMMPHLEDVPVAVVDDHTVLLTLGADASPVTFFDRDDQGRHARIHSGFRTVNRTV